MIKILVVLCAFVGAYAVAKGILHLGDTGCWIAAVVVGMCGFGLSSKG